MSKTILVGALNWGLGHATRCIPIINALQKRGLQVVLAADGAALALWQEHYPALPSVELPSYNIHYPSTNMVWNMARQLPQILKAIHLERQQTESLVKKYAIDAIISDNRYGLRHVGIPSVFVSHQLHLALPTWVIPPLVNKLHQRYIGAFDRCWVPDRAGTDNLAGALAHPALKGVAYIGALSRFSPMVPLEKEWDVLAVLSGPEPQRQYLETALKEQLLALPYKSLLVRGKPNSQERQCLGKQVYQQDFMPQAALQRVFGQSGLIIARSGYSTLLDLAALQIPKALLIPTPGQTEQEYLAKRLSAQGRCVYQSQTQLHLKNGLAALTQLAPVLPTPPSSNALEQSIDELLQDL
ncbi:MAG: glycosyltransferase [Aureispira sp.]